MIKKTLEEMTAEGNGLCLDFIDYPTAFAIVELGLDHASQNCSSVQTTGAVLCDCDAMSLKWAELKTEFDGSDGMALAARYLQKGTKNEG